MTITEVVTDLCVEAAEAAHKPCRYAAQQLAATAQIDTPLGINLHLLDSLPAGPDTLREAKTYTSSDESTGTLPSVQPSSISSRVGHPPYPDHSDPPCAHDETDSDNPDSDPDMDPNVPGSGESGELLGIRVRVRPATPRGARTLVWEDAELGARVWSRPSQEPAPCNMDC